MRCNYKYILQDSYNDCGLSSLATCLLNFGKKVSLQELQSQIKITEKGLSLYQLTKLSKKYDLNPLPVKGNINHINNNDLPCIAHTIKDKSFFHYIVIFKKHNNKLEIFDPSIGLKEITVEDFNKITTNIFLLFDNKTKQKDNTFKLFLKSVISSYKKEIALMIIMSIAIILITLYINNLIENLSNNVFIALLIMLIFKNILNFYKNKVTNAFYYKLDKNLVDKILMHITRLPNTSFNQKSVGEFSVFFEDIETLKELIIQIFLFCFIDIVILLILIIYLSFYNSNLLLIITIYLFIMYLIYNKYHLKLNDNYQKYKRKYIEFKTELIDKLSGFSTIKSLNIENKARNIINDKNNERLHYQKELENNNNTYHNIVNIINDLIYFVFLLLSLLSEFNLISIIVISNLIPVLTATSTNIYEIAITYNFYESSFIRILKVIMQPESNKKIKDNIYVAPNYLFSGTLYSNLKLVNEDEQEISKAYKTVFYNQNFNLEVLKQILIINNGSNLSESTKNKILLMRLLLSNKKTIILDAYKNLDKKIINNIYNNYPDIKVVLSSKAKYYPKVLKMKGV